MLGLYCHSHIKFISFCHHFPGVPARTGRQEKEREVIHSKDRSETLCLQRTQYFMWEMPRSSRKKNVRTINKSFQPLCRTWTWLLSILVGPLLCFHFHSLESIFQFDLWILFWLFGYLHVCCSVSVCLWLLQSCLITWHVHHEESPVIWKARHTQMLLQDEMLYR